MKHLFFTLFTIHCSLFILLTLAGCGKDIQFGGTVKYPDGTPVAGALVVFTNGGKFQYDGRTDEQGRYQLSGATPQSGLPAGEYGVAVSLADDSGWLIPERYTSAATSGLTATVDGKAKTFDIQVERAEKKK